MEIVNDSTIVEQTIPAAALTGEPYTRNIPPVKTIPLELRERVQWITYRLVAKPKHPGKFDKVPVRVTGANASSTDAATWATFTAAHNAARGLLFEKVHGVGFVLVDGGGVVGIDLDHCIDEHGVVADWAQRIVERFDSYTEVSPSLRGLRILVRGSKPSGKSSNGRGFEWYDSGRFLTITGRCVRRAGVLATATPEAMAATAAEVFGSERPTDAPTAPPVHAEHADDLERAVKLAEVTDETMRDLRQVLAALPSDNREDWIKVGLGLKATGRDDAFEVWDEWSRKSPLYDADDMRDRWDGFEPSSITHASVFALAAERGIANPATKPVVLAPTVEPRVDRPLFVPISWDEIKKSPPMRWFIDDTLPEGLSMIYGPPKSGKSFIVLDMALAVARGVQWRDKRVKRAGTVVYVAAEGKAGVKARVYAYLAHHSIEQPGDFHMITDAPNLLLPPSVEALGRAIELTTGCDLLIVDTLAASSAGAEENSAKDAGIVVAHCKALAARLDCSVIVVHHSGKDVSKGARGSNSWQGAVDSMMAVEKGGIARTGTLINTDMKDGATFDPIGFQLRAIETVNDEGLPISSCVVEWTERPAPKCRADAGLKGNQKVVYDTVADLIELADGDGIDLEPVLVAAKERLHRPEGRPDNRRSQARQALDRLAEKGVLVVSDEDWITLGEAT